MHFLCLFKQSAFIMNAWDKWLHKDTIEKLMRSFNRITIEVIRGFLWAQVSSSLQGFQESWCRSSFHMPAWLLQNGVCVFVCVCDKYKGQSRTDCSPSYRWNSSSDLNIRQEQSECLLTGPWPLPALTLGLNHWRFPSLRTVRLQTATPPSMSMFLACRLCCRC